MIDEDMKTPYGEFTKIVYKKIPHSCVRPATLVWQGKPLDVGTQWQCKDCLSYFEVVRPPINSVYQSLRWMRITYRDSGGNLIVQL